MIPLYKPSITSAEIEYVNDCLTSGWISSKGKYVNQFEKCFSDFLKIEHSVSVSNGTVALHLALLALNICTNDEVLVPAFTYIASVNCIKYVGASPVFIASQSCDFQIDTKDLSALITPRTKAIIVPHLYGHIGDMDEIVKICRTHNIAIVEDCAEALGSTFKGKNVGHFGDISTFSFFGNKTVSTGEGGMVCTNNKDFAERIRHLKAQAVSDTIEYWHDEVGYNYRMTNICAAIGLAQMERIETTVKRKQIIAEYYMSEINNELIKVLTPQPNCISSFWIVTIILPSSDIRDRLRILLSENGIETRPTFPMANTMPMFNECRTAHNLNSLPSQTGVNLPSFPDLTKEELRDIVKVLNEFEG